jgi:hypothetical protein
MSAVWEGFTRRRSMPASLRRVLLRVGIGVGFLLCVLFISGLLISQLAVGNAQKMTLEPRGPGSASICVSSVDAACAAKASARIHVPVAWMLAPAGYSVQWLGAAGGPKVEKDHRIGFEDLTSARIHLEIETQPSPPWQPGNKKLLGTWVENGDAVSVYSDLYGYPSGDPAPTTMTLRWTHIGVQYQMFVRPHYFLDRLQLDPATFANMVRTVRYGSIGRARG